MLNAAPVIATILGPRNRPVRKRLSNQYRYLFHMRYLDDLLLAFPMATKSTGLQRRLDRLNTTALKAREVDPFEIPGLWDYKLDKPAEPYHYQYMAIADGVRYLSGEMDNVESADFAEHFLENDEMGLGKTLIALCIILMMIAINEDNGGKPLHILVVAPKNGKFVWERENKRWARIDYALIDADMQTPGERAELIRRRSTITIINPEMLRGDRYPDLFNFRYDYIFIDEYHRFGSPKSQQTQGFLQLRARKFLPMSGTPFLSRPEQMWPILHRCWPTMFPNYEMFVKSIQVIGTGGKIVGYNPKITRKLKEFMEPRSIRRRKDQVMPDLPPVVTIGIPVTLNREQQRIYNLIRDEMKLLLESGSQQKIFNAFTQVMRLKQACFSPELFGGSRHSAKLDELGAYIEQLVASNEKAIIFSEWAKATRIMQREFAEFSPAYVDGSVTGTKRMAQADYFNLDPSCHLYIGTIGANQEAVSLSAATTVLFTDKDPRPMVNSQAAGRSAGGGLRGLEAKVDKITVATLFARDTYEERIEEVLAFREAVFNAQIEGDGGAQIERQSATSLLSLI